MNKKRYSWRYSWLCLLVGILWVTAGFAWASGSSAGTGGVQGQTDVMAGVVVDYMGKVQFRVLDRETETPVAGASVELYIPALDRYVLVGMSDESGVFEMDIAYNRNSNLSEAAQFINGSGKAALPGSLLHLDSNQLKYQVYKADWLPYPNKGSVELELKDLPQVVTVYLYQEEPEEPTTGEPTTEETTTEEAATEGPTTEAPTTEAPTEPPTKPSTSAPATSGGSGDGDGDGSTPAGSRPWKQPPGERDSQMGNAINQVLEVIDDMMVPLNDTQGGGIPKTGVEGTMGYWLTGMILFLLAGGLSWRLVRLDADREKRDRRA